MDEKGATQNNLLKVDETTATEIRTAYKQAEEGKKGLSISVISAMGINGVAALKQVDL